MNTTRACRHAPQRHNQTFVRVFVVFDCFTWNILPGFSCLALFHVKHCQYLVAFPYFAGQSLLALVLRQCTGIPACMFVCLFLSAPAFGSGGFHLPLPLQVLLSGWQFCHKVGRFRVFFLRFVVLLMYNAALSFCLLSAVPVLYV